MRGLGASVMAIPSAWDTNDLYADEVQEVVPSQSYSSFVQQKYPQGLLPEPVQTPAALQRNCVAQCRKQCRSGSTGWSAPVAQKTVVRSWQGLAPDGYNRCSYVQYSNGDIEQKGCTLMYRRPSSCAGIAPRAPDGRPDAERAAAYIACVNNGGKMVPMTPNMPGSQPLCYPCQAKSIPVLTLKGLSDLGIPGPHHHHSRGFRSGYSYPMFDYITPVYLTESQAQNANRCDDLDLECKKKEVARLEKLEQLRKLQNAEQGISGLGAGEAGIGIGTLAIAGAVAWLLLKK
jgi:hypothetical protein